MPSFRAKQPSHAKIKDKRSISHSCTKHHRRLQSNKTPSPPRSLEISRNLENTFFRGYMVYTIYPWYMMCHFRKHVFPSPPFFYLQHQYTTLRYFPQVPGVCRQRVSSQVLCWHFSKAGFVTGMNTGFCTYSPKAASTAPPAAEKGYSSLALHPQPQLSLLLENTDPLVLWTGGGQKLSNRASLSVGNNFYLEPNPNSSSKPTFSSKVSRVQNKWKEVANNLSK